jgi:hypothetical protein
MTTNNKDGSITIDEHARFEFSFGQTDISKPAGKNTFNTFKSFMKSVGTDRLYQGKYESFVLYNHSYWPDPPHHLVDKASTSYHLDNVIIASEKNVSLLPMLKILANNDNFDASNIDDPKKLARHILEARGEFFVDDDNANIAAVIAEAEQYGIALNKDNTVFMDRNCNKKNIIDIERSF